MSVNQDDTGGDAIRALVELVSVDTQARSALGRVLAMTMFQNALAGFVAQLPTVVGQNPPDGAGVTLADMSPVLAAADELPDDIRAAIHTEIVQLYRLAHANNQTLLGWQELLQATRHKFASVDVGPHQLRIMTLLEQVQESLGHRSFMGVATEMANLLQIDVDEYIGPDEPVADDGAELGNAAAMKTGIDERDDELAAAGVEAEIPVDAKTQTAVLQQQVRRLRWAVGTLSAVALSVLLAAGLLTHSAYQRADEQTRRANQPVRVEIAEPGADDYRQWEVALPTTIHAHGQTITIRRVHR